MGDRTDTSKMVRVNQMDGGLLVKMDPRAISSRFWREAKNMRFASGVPTTRKGNIRAATLTRPEGGMQFANGATAYLSIVKNASCPIWSGIGPDLSFEMTEKPVSMPAVPTTNTLFLFGWGAAAGTHTTFAIKAGTGKVAGYPKHSRWLFIKEEGETALEKLIGTVDADLAGDPESRRHYYRIRKTGADLDALLMGSDDLGIQYTSWDDAFTSDDAKLEDADGEVRVGGKGISGTELGMASVIDEIRLWNHSIEYGDKYRWSAHPMLEQIELLLRLSLDEGTGSVAYDTSLWGNHAMKNGAPTWATTGLVEGMMVGQEILEFAPPGKRHRLVVAGGSIFREVVQ